MNKPYRQLAIDLGGTGDMSCGGIERLEVSVKQFRKVLANHPSLFCLENAQNDSPAMKQFLDIAKDDDTFMCYVVSDDRSDKRVTIEGIITQHDEVAEALRAISRPDEDSHGSMWWD